MSELSLTVQTCTGVATCCANATRSRALPRISKGAPTHPTADLDTSNPRKVQRLAPDHPGDCG